jgi:Protein of unknown function (DUF3352)
MNDDLDPAIEPATPDPDPTTKVELPTTPSAPLTPASREYAAPETYEHKVALAAVAPTAPVVPTARPRRSHRLRWALGIAVVALVIATSAAVAALIAGRSADATVLGYVPDQTIAYGEVRMDLPGDQRLAVGEFLSKFPGFQDQAALETKLDQVLDDLVKNATNGSQTYTTDIKPWFGGELAFSEGALPPAASLSGADPSAAMASVRMLALVSIKDAPGAQAWFDAAFAKAGAKTTSETYNGATVTKFEATGGLQPAFAIVDGKVAVAGDIASVKAAIDTKGNGGFSNGAGPKAAFAALPDDHVGFVYVALRPLLDWASSLSKVTAAAAASQLTLSDTILKALPEWGAYALRFESDALVMEAVAPKPETVLGPTENRTSTVLEHIPSNAIVAGVTNDVGPTLKQTLDLYRTDPAFKSAVDSIDQALGLVGGADAAVGWAGDAAIVVSAPDGALEGGLIVAPTDKAAADHLFTSLRSFIAIGGAQQGISVKDETYNGTTITTVSGKVPVPTLGGNANGGQPATMPVEISYAVTDDIVVVGSGPSFVKHVLDTTKDTSLASNERYTKQADRAGKGTSSAFVDITAIRGMIEPHITDPAAKAKYESDIKPFLVPFDVLFASSSTGDPNHSLIYITVK